MILKIAVVALLITLAVTIVGTILLLRQAGKPEEERTSPIFAPEHIENPQTQEDWDAWEKDPWMEQWEDWDDWDQWKLQKPDGPENREKAANPVNGEKRKPTEDPDGLKDQENTDKPGSPAEHRD